MISFLEEDIRRHIPGAEIGINTWSLRDFDRYDRLTPDQQAELQEEMFGGFDGCEHASPENLENFEKAAEDLIREMLGSTPTP
jgi:DNA-directed RNA polymerase delta subunit